MNKYCPTCGGFGKVYRSDIKEITKYIYVTDNESEYVKCPDCDGVKTITREDIISLLWESGADYRKTLKEEK